MNNQTDSNNTTKKRRGPADGPALKSGGYDARKTAALVLEVLSGELNPSEAAEILQVSLPRYYQIEKRALEGLIRACEAPAHKGRQKSEALRIKELQQELSIQQREVRRVQALLRAGQKASGIATAVAQACSRKPESGRKRRKPVARALKAAKSLRKEGGAEPEQLPINAVTGGVPPHPFIASEEKEHPLLHSRDDTMAHTLREGCDGAGTNNQRQRSGGQAGGLGTGAGAAQGHSGHAGRQPADCGGLRGARDLRGDVLQAARPVPAGGVAAAGAAGVRPQTAGAGSRGGEATQG